MEVKVDDEVEEVVVWWGIGVGRVVAAGEPLEERAM